MKKSNLRLFYPQKVKRHLFLCLNGLCYLFNTGKCFYSGHFYLAK